MRKIILTNDRGEEMSVIEFYNQRSCEGEHHFKELDNDFGWNKLPFDNIEMNTIYMYSTIVAYLLFNICKAPDAIKKFQAALYNLNSQMDKNRSPVGT